MQKRTLQVSFIALTAFLLVGCSHTTKESSSLNAESAPAATDVDASKTITTQNNNTTLAPQIRTITMTARQFSFEPSSIEVNEGDTVKLSVTSVDTTHGFRLPEFGVSLTLRPNQTSTAEFVANKKGTFPFSCSVVCGAGHNDMNGTLTVK